MEQIKQYIINLYQDIPTEVYEGLLSIFCIGVVGLFVSFGWIQGWKKVVGLLLSEYVFLVYCSTVICRKVAGGVLGYNFNPFWSYNAIKNGREDLVAENIMNVVVFVPVGLLLGLITLKMRNVWRTRIARIAIVIGVGLIISISIEAMQYFFYRGFAETDDVMHNTLGCLIGFMIVVLIERLWLLLKGY